MKHLRWLNLKAENETPHLIISAFAFVRQYYSAILANTTASILNMPV
jgi:hypothetical protein